MYPTHIIPSQSVLSTCGQVTFAMQGLMPDALPAPVGPHPMQLLVCTKQQSHGSLFCEQAMSRQSTAAAGREGLYCFRQMKVYPGN